MSDIVVMNYDTGEIVSGTIPKPSVEWLCENFYIPFINAQLEKERRGVEGIASEEKG